MSYSERTIEKEERLYGYDTKEPLKRDEGLLGEEDRLKNLSLSGANQNVIVLHPVGEPSLLTTESRFEQPILERPIIEQPIMEQPIFEQPIFEQPIRERPLETATVYEQEYIRKPVLPAGEGALATEGAVGTDKLSKREKKKLLLTPEERAAKNAKLSKLTGAKREKALAKRRAKIEKREWKIRYLNEQIAILSGASALGTSDYGYSGRSDVAGIGSTPSVGYSSGASSSYASGWSSTGVTGASDIGYAGETKPGLMTRLKQKFSRTKTPEDREAKLTRLRGLSGVERDEMLAKKRHKVNLAEEKVRYLREQIALLEERPLTTDVSSTGYTGYSSGYSSGLLTGAAVSSTACPHVQTGYEPCATCLPSTIQLTPMTGAPIVQPVATFATVTAVSPLSRPAVTPVVAPVTPIAPATETGLVRDVEGSLATRDLLASETTATTETTHAGKYGGAHSIGEMLSAQRDFDTASRTDVGVVSPSGRVISSERGLSSDRVISPRSGAAGLAATEPVVAATTVPGLTGGAAPIAGMETAAEGRYGGAHSIREMLSKDKDFPALARQAEATGTVPATEHKPGFIERIADKLTGKHHRETAHP